MPSTNKRINLTIPDNIYQRIVAYKNENGILNDTSACYQLMIQQLNAYEQSKAMMELIKKVPLEDLQRISMDGLSYVKNNVP